MDALVYVKVPKSVQVTNKKIYLRDVLEINGENTNLVKRLGDIVLYTVSDQTEKKLFFSTMKLIGLMTKACPGIRLEILGEVELIVDYKAPKEEKKWLEVLKLILLTFIVFIGASFTIMTFNTDVSVTDVFDHVYRLVTGTEKTKGSVLEIAYCVGVFVGILGFYNHFRLKKQKEDPTPIHVEMRNYEDQLEEVILKDAGREGKVIK